ncbi:LysR family transcriptional regulator [Rhodococcoides trifolii]|uniref:LysR family transcriptional regulator n=1 Tax=Rhodococcoides trifolii TaxID=908250 RepID=A0A917G5V3_9NOCA|nr:LysR family transcriptional regulator [Rhodococcus trifolii]GGG24384.1 LysR family transcriptional regulator [Rhodococcus trifolii]
MTEWSLSGLRVVRAVFETGSFTAAAQTLGYTQSAISRQVASVEAAAGSTLFERGARGVRPTAAGTLVASRAATVLNEIDAATRDLATARNLLTGTASVGAFPTAAMVLVPRAIGRIRQSNPELTVEMVESSTPTQLRQLRAGRIDVAVVAVGHGLPEYDLDELRVETVIDGKLLVAVASDHGLAHRGRVDVAELERESWIVGKGARDDPQFGAWPTLPEPRIGMRVRDWSARMGCVAAGLGITVIPEIAAATVPDGVTTVQVDDLGWGGRTTYAITVQGRSASTSAVVGAVRAEARTIREEGRRA